MTTGHVNAGYSNIVSQHYLGLQNPAGSRTPFIKNNQELQEIREAAKAVWSVKDNYETTYKRYHGFFDI
jgi:hypothetical protein